MKASQDTACRSGGGGDEGDGVLQRYLEFGRHRVAWSSAPPLVRLMRIAPTLAIVVGILASCSSAKDFVAERAAVGTWTCEAIQGDNLHPSSIVIDVRSDNTFEMLEDARDGINISGLRGEWSVVDGNLRAELDGEPVSANGVDELEIGENEFSVLWEFQDDLSVDIRSDGEFTIVRDGAEESSPPEHPWTCRKGPPRD